MKPKNIMLLGFVNKAVEYLDKHMDEEPDTRLAELKNIDLASIKEELNDNLDASLGTMQSTMSTLLKAGNEAFDKFIEDNHGKGSIPDQFNKMFDVDLDEKSTNNEELARLLSFYNLENDFEVEEKHEIGNDYVESIEDNQFLQEIKKNATNDDTNEIVPIERNEKEDAEIDSIFNEIVEHENIEEEAEIESEEKQNKKEKDHDVFVEQKKPKEVQKTQTYVSSLIDDLRAQLVKEEKIRKAHEDKNKEVYERIAKIYPYLPESFYKSVYELKENLASEYRDGLKIIVLHRVKFKDVENLRKFVEIGLNHEYTINADESKMIVDIFKEFVNSDGKILTNIFEIANQGYLLEGEYEGYNVIVEEE